METLKTAFLLVDWDKPFSEFTAAKEAGKVTSAVE
jgi:hypothetical protein